MIKIRQNIFETNSSSTHSLVLCDNKTWEDFVDNKVFYNVLSRYHKEYLEKYPLDKYKWVPEDSCLNDLPIFCTFGQIKNYISKYHDMLSDVLFEKKLNKENINRIHSISSDLLFLKETFYSIDELEDCNYNKETGELDLDYYFG